MSEWSSIKEIVEDVTTGKVTALANVERSLRLIAEHQEFQAIISTIENRSKLRAQEIDEMISGGKSVGRLAGVPFIAKDNFLTFDSETTAASNILRGFRAPYQSSVIEMLESEGAICVAKSNMDAFGHGSSTQNSDFMTTKNPHDKSRVSGGSSGGSAASVVLGFAPFALGTDTGGSIRHPASLSGCVGYKPTYGLISRSGVISMASSTDTVGFLTNSVDDLSLLVDVTAGVDNLDSTTVSRDTVSYCDLDTNMKGKKIGVIKEWLTEGVDPEVKTLIEKSVKRLEKLGAEMFEVSLPSLPLALAAYYIVVPAEISSNLSRYDGQRYGHNEPSSTDLEQSYQMARGNGFGTEAKRRIMIGSYVLSSGFYDAYYHRAQLVRTKLINEFNDVFSKVDFLVGPVAPNIAFEIGKNTDDPLHMYLEDIMTVAPSLAGIPGVSIPAGKVRNLPVGMQILASRNQDRSLLGIAKAFEAAA